jgi:sigma-E factor negative regulatory protein RseB
MLLAAALCVAQTAAAQTGIVSAPRSRAKVKASVAPAPATARGVFEWLQSMYAASRQHSYAGTFVVSVESGELSSARIWHAHEGDLQMERIETLSGPRRSTFRRNDRVVTFLPELKLVKSEQRENIEQFPNLLLGAPDSSIADFYGVRVLGEGRVAGFQADVVQLDARDDLRFGYRVWAERRSGLVVKLQTIERENKVIEQSAFSDLMLDTPVKIDTLKRMMNRTGGYRVEKSELERSSAQREGWTLRQPVTGFKAISCYRRLAVGGDAQGRAMQWTFSDGLALVSLFVESYDAGRKNAEITFAQGATHMLTRRLPGKDGDWWLTAVGEVPTKTLDAFAQVLARAP